MKKSKSVAAAGGRHASAGTDRRRAITDVALRLFAERSFAEVTIKDIAGRLHINTALIYYYFKNKEDLFRACLESAVYEAMTSYGAIRGPHDNPGDRIDGWFESNLKLSDTISNMVKVMLDYATSPLRLPTVDRLIQQFYDEELSLLVTALEDGASLGLFRRVDNERLARLVSVHLDGIMVAAIIRPQFDLANAVSALRDLLFDHLGYRRAPSARPAPARPPMHGSRVGSNRRSRRPQGRQRSR